MVQYLELKEKLKTDDETLLSALGFTWSSRQVKANRISEFKKGRKFTGASANLATLFWNHPECYEKMIFVINRGLNRGLNRG